LNQDNQVDFDELVGQDPSTFEPSPDSPSSLDEGCDCGQEEEEEDYIDIDDLTEEELD